MRDLATSLAAVLVAQGCNLGFAPIVKPGHPALTRDRLSHVAQDYVRAEPLAAANARLITAQSRIDSRVRTGTTTATRPPRPADHRPTTATSSRSSRTSGVT